MTILNPKLKGLVAGFLASVAFASCNSDYEFAYLYEDLPFEMEQVQRPSIPPREVDIRDFGGVGDGVTLNSDAFSKAIEVLSELGGGRLTVPAGVWLQFRRKAV